MSDDKRYTVGIVGCGRVAALHAEAYNARPRYPSWWAAADN